MARARVVLVVAHDVVRASLRSVLSVTPDIEVVGDASDSSQALRLVEQLVPDVLVLDIDMSRLNGFALAQRLRATRSPVHILALSAYEDKQFILGYLAEGVTGYLVKDDAPQTIVDAVRRVSRGQQWLSPRAVDRVGKSLPPSGESLIDCPLARAYPTRIQEHCQNRESDPDDANA
jgi:DNA-binding NarL/FixJ family response regulator